MIHNIQSIDNALQLNRETGIILDPINEYAFTLNLYKTMNHPELFLKITHDQQAFNKQNYYHHLNFLRHYISIQNAHLSKHIKVYNPQYDIVYTFKEPELSFTQYIQSTELANMVQEYIIVEIST